MKVFFYFCVAVFKLKDNFFSPRAFQLPDLSVDILLIFVGRAYAQELAVEAYKQGFRDGVQAYQALIVK